MNDVPRSPSLDGRRFVSLVPADGGEVNPETVFDYHENDGDIWATYAGGPVRRGYLVGTRTGDVLSFRYSHLNTNGDTASGRCESQITMTDDGRLQLLETWEWESRDGSGTSTLEELR